MIGHDVARRSAASAIDFELRPDEQAELDAHLRSCATCRAVTAGLAADAAGLHNLDLGPVPMTVRADVAIRAERHGSGGRTWTVLLATAALLVLVIVGGAAVGIGGRRGGPEGDPAAAPPVGRAVHWSTDVVDLEADDLWLQVGGQVVVPPDDREVRISSDPGDPGYWTLEVSWVADRVEQRINLYFSADDMEWRIDEARIYDGRIPGDWLETRDVPVRVPLGTSFAGDLDVTLADRSGPDTGPGRLVMRGLRLAARAGGGSAPGVDPLKPVVGGAPAPPPAMTVDCGPIDRAACAALVTTVAAEVEASHPNRTVIGVTVAPDGLGWTVFLDDGSAVTAVQ